MEVAKLKSLVIALTLAVAVLSLTTATVADTASASTAAKTVGSLTLQGKTVPQIALRLAGIAAVPFGIESLDRTSLWNSTSEESAKRIDLSGDSQMTLASAMDSAVAKDPRYEWRFVNGWLLVMPRTRDAAWPLDKVIEGGLPDSGAPDAQLRQLVSSSLPADWTIQLVARYPHDDGVRADLAPVPAVLTLRDALDTLLWRMGAKGWVASPLRDSKGNVRKHVIEVLM